MKKVVINASGGGKEIGASGNGLVEKDMTLLISEIIGRRLENAGVEVFYLRDNDATISYDDRIKKIKDKYGNATDIILLSNTLNSGGGSGIEIIYPLKDNNVLASKIGSALDYFNTTRYYQYRWPTDTMKDYYYITRMTPDYETIIVRYGYVDNAADAKIIKDDYEAMADAVSLAILDYLGVSEDGYYTVVAGDTLYALAKRFNTTVDELKQLNNLKSNALSIGQKLKLPSTTNKPTAPSTSESPAPDNTYKVVKGDTLYSIAKKFNISVEKLKEINNLSNNLISIGQILKISNLKSYKVKKGDTLYAIAKANNTTVDEIKRINNLTSNNLAIDQVLYLP